MAAELLPPLRNYLIAQGIVRKPSVAGELPPLWLDPRDGVPLPGAGENAVEIGPTAVLGAFQVSGIPRERYEQRILRTDAVDVWIRTKTAPAVHSIADALVEALADLRQWDMSGLPIIESLLFRPLQRLGSDEDSFDWTMQFTFERYA